MTDVPMTDDACAGRPAATMIVVRDWPAQMQPQQAPQILMLERSPNMAFAAGALVFPGGAVDEGDRALAAPYAGDLSLDEASGRVAAIRETIEEAGIGIGIAGEVSAAAVTKLRDGLAGGEPFRALLDQQGLALDLRALTPFARWQPKRIDSPKRVFDVRFYLAGAPEGQVASVDGTENTRLFWSSAADTLALCDAGEGAVIYPTRRNLERLALSSSLDAMQRQAAAFPIEKITPWAEMRNGEMHLCIPDYLGYPIVSEPVTPRHRS